MLQKYQSSLLTIIHYLRDHLREDYHRLYYLLVGLFLAVSVYLNYFLIPGTTLENAMYYGYRNQEILILWYLVFYSTPYFAALLMYSLTHGEWGYFRKGTFWLYSLLGLLLLSFDAMFYYYRHLPIEALDPAMRYFILKCASTLTSAVVIGLPLFLFKWWVDRQDIGYFGLHFRGFDYRAYVLLLLGMLPIVLVASFGQDFINYYPTIKLFRLEKLSQLHPDLALLIYEFWYLLDFLWTELIFRGFFVVGMAFLLGKNTVVPMAALYCFRHFSKPMGEAISSIFGGYILGVIALKTRNIMGGVYVHVGIALLMDLFAYLQKVHFA